MTAPQQQRRDSARPWFILLFLAAAALNIVLAVVDWNADKLVIAVLFVAVANLTRTTGIYRRQLGLER